MVTNEMQFKLELIHALKEQKAEIEAQIEALSDSVKAEMDAHGVSSLTAGNFSAKYTRYFSQRFDSAAFKEEHEDMYIEYTKSVPSTRFTVSVKSEKEAK